MNTRRRPWRALWLGLCLCGAGGLWWYWNRPAPLSTPQLLADARKALRHGDYPKAEQLATRVLLQSDASPAALLIAGESAAKLNRFDDAVAYYGRVPDRGDETALRAIAAKAELLFMLGRFSACEAALRRALALDPENPLVLSRLVDVLGASGRRWESRTYLFHLVRLGKFNVEALFQLADYARSTDAEPLVEKALTAVPDDPNPLLARARFQLYSNKAGQARETLWQVIGARPGNLDAQALLGEVLVDLQREGEFHKWRKQLPREADGHPDVWFVRGLWAEKNGQLEAAARCYREAIRIEPDQRSANFHIAVVLKALGRAAAGEPFVKRATLLMELDVVVNAAYGMKQVTTQDAPRMARVTEALGRYWEAWAWNAVLAQQGADSAVAARDRLKRILDEQNPPQTLKNFNPALQIDVRQYPLLPDWSRRREVSPPNDTGRFGSAPTQAEARFIDSTHAVGIDFSYENGEDLSAKRTKLHQTFGGGVAVLDYDGDGWPDLHFTQGAREPFDDDDTSHVDRLYRNLGNGRFADVTMAAGVPEHRYSQGATVGDYDNDGFPDLFVSNIGKSRLYRNNGDGTFADVTVSAGITLDHWSTSSLLADLNGDGLPDIFDVTYLRDRKVLHQLCGPEFGNSCTPAGLPGDVDRLLLNLGDGTFRDVTEEAGLAAWKGNGLGLVAADFDRSGRLSLFVANDTEANFYLANQTPQRGALPLFVERGVLHGLAFDRDGKAQANMGIAADDCNGDGLLDLYVTAFFDDSKTLRVQQSEQMFVDVTREANLRDSGFPVLGFGTQFLDGELDGLPDLVVANGHVYDWTSKGIPFEMPPQYFRNVGAGRFIEKSAASLGPYFEARHLGRGLARLDWNRDGREDFVVSHIHSPAALVTNQTAGAGHFLAVRLAAVNSARDAIGAIATLTAGDFTRVRELTAGDGYYASNQRELVFGLGKREKIDKLVVRWPSGGEQKFSELQVDREYLLIENRETPVALSVDRPEAVVESDHPLN